MTPRRSLRRSGEVSPPRFGPGARVRVVANSNQHSYRVGGVYVIESVDADTGGMRARDPATGEVGNWLRAGDLTRASELGWEWLAARLAPRDRALLEAFDGLEALELNEAIKAELVSEVPELEAAIRAALASGA